MHLLLVEDDRMIGEALSRSLKSTGYAVDWVSDGEAAILAIEVQRYDICLLDLGLPKKDGMSVLMWLRRRNDDLPVLILTARDTVEDRVKGLDSGADDYLVKPFELSELLARLRSILRRQNGQSSPILSNGIISLNPATREAERDGQVLRLTAREYALLYTLMLRPGTILSRQDLEEKLYGWDEEVESNVVEFVIHSIRKKLGMDVIKNIRGLGWMVDKAI